MPEPLSGPSDDARSREGILLMMVQGTPHVLYASNEAVVSRVPLN